MKNLFALSFVLLSFLSYAQNKLTRSLQKKEAFELVTKNEVITIKNYNSIKQSEKEFLVESPKNNGSIYMINVNENSITGFYLDESKEYGYTIKSDTLGEMVYTKTPANEILYTCKIDSSEHDHKHSVVTRGPNSPPVYIGNYATETDVYKLQSKPGADKCIYLDFDGEDMSQFSWSYDGTVRYVPNSLVKKIWEALSTDFLPFDVNVTNDVSVYNSYANNKRMMTLFMDFVPERSWAGIAILNSFGSETRPALVDLKETPDASQAYLFRTPAHELGHTLGLRHDGKSPTHTYYGGHGEYGPIMGTGYNKFTLWSKGEYQNADNQEDDLQMITSVLGRTADDNASTRMINANANGDVFEADNHGTIDWHNDVDEWTFELASAGNVDLTFDPSVEYTNLDIHLVIEDQNGNEILNINPIGERKARINQTLPAGIYTAKIQSGGELTVHTGWSVYSVFGYYEIYGRIEGTVQDEYDLQVNSIADLDPMCRLSADIELNIEVQNTGLNDFNSLDFEVYSGTTLLASISKYTPLTSGSLGNYTLNFDLPEEENSIEIRVLDPQNRETNLTNNSSSFQSNLTLGHLYTFQTTYSPFDKDDQVWTITNNLTNEVVYGSDIATVSSNGVISQETCLQEVACYDFEMSGDLNSCSSEYPTWTAGTYVGGDRVIRSGVVYEAKWWTTSRPPNSEWEVLGNCNNELSEFTLIENESSSTMFSFSSSEYASPYSTSFCSITTGVEDVDKESSISVFPNPIKNTLNIKSDKPGYVVSIYNLSGKLVHQESSVSTALQLDLSSLKSGFYFLKTDIDNNLIKVIKTN